MTIATVVPGVLTVASAFPDPPFELVQGGVPAGLDVALTQAICSTLGLSWRSYRYAATDFNGIFDGLESDAWDCVASGTTVTPERRKKADFCVPYLRSGQSLVCNAERNPSLRSIDDLAGRVIAVQHGNTSQPVAEKMRAEGQVADVRVYPYGGITDMLDDLESGKIDAIMKLAPVMRWLVRDRPNLKVVQENITDEWLAISVRRGNAALCGAIDRAQAVLTADGTLARLVHQWIEP